MLSEKLAWQYETHEEKREKMVQIDPTINLHQYLISDIFYTHFYLTMW